MNGMLVDSNVILDVFLNDPQWGDASEGVLEEYGQAGALYINPIVYSEVSVGFERIEDLEAAVAQAGFRMLEIPREALFLAGKAYLKYKRRGGSRTGPLPDFYIGAQAAVLELGLITRDPPRYRSYFPAVRTIRPER